MIIQGLRRINGNNTKFFLFSYLNLCLTKFIVNSTYVWSNFHTSFSLFYVCVMVRIKSVFRVVPFCILHTTPKIKRHVYTCIYMSQQSDNILWAKSNTFHHNWCFICIKQWLLIDVTFYHSKYKLIWILKYYDNKICKIVNTIFRIIVFCYKIYIYR